MIQIIDNFYSSVDELIDLSHNCASGGCGYGERSEDLSIIAPELYDQFKQFLFSQYGLNKNHHLTTYLTKHVFEANISRGLIHIDGRNPNSCDITTKTYDLVLCGLVFLTPCLDTNSGISFYDTNPNVNWDKEKEFQICLNDCYTYNDDQRKTYHNNFHETIAVKNKQNRFVSWTAGSKYRNIITEKQNERIVQNFYVSMV